MTNTESNCPTCAGYIRLCRGLNFFPTDPAVWELLVDRLHRAARDHEQAKLMIDFWLDTERDAPKVADLVHLGSMDLRPIQALPDGCEVCHGEPWVVDDKGARRCVCARGKALAAR